MLLYFKMPNSQEISACPSDSVLPLLPTATLLAGQSSSCGRRHVAGPLCSFRGTCSAKLTLQKGPNTGPWHGEGRKLLSCLETWSLFSACRFGYSDPWALF